MIPGKKVMAIYGFCDIRNYTDCTEILQEKAMIFVNEIAEIVHEIASDHCGSPNKNVGDAFLIVWKFEDKFVEKDEEGNLVLKKCNEVYQMVDLALVAILKILAKIQKSFKLDKVNIL
jgi:class 3 adenylate cyclase